MYWAIYKYGYQPYTHPSEALPGNLDLTTKVLNACVALQTWAQKKQTNILLNDDAVSMIDAIIGIAIGLIVLVAVFSLAPVIGFNIDASTSIPAGSQWNATTNPDMTTGNELWTQNSTLLILALMVSILGLVIYSIMRIRDGSTGGQ